MAPRKSECLEIEITRWLEQVDTRLSSVPFVQCADAK